MASIIKIKRSGTAGAPSSLKLGELAYSYLTGDQSNGGDRLYIGAGGVDGGGNANDIAVVGGKYFTDKLDHVEGTLTASSAIITDANNKIDQLNVDNLTIDGNTISSTDTNGDITLDPNGTGAINVSSSRITNLSAPIDTTDAATKQYVDGITGGSGISLSISGETGSSSISLANSDLTFAGTGLQATVSGNTVTYSLDNSGVVAGNYGSTSAIPSISVTAEGLIDSIGTVAISTTLNTSGDVGTGSVDLGTQSLSINGGYGVNTTSLDQSISIEVDSAEIITLAQSAFSAGNGIDISGAGDISISTTDSIQLASLQVTGNAVFDGNLQVNGTQTIINTQTLSIQDNMFYLNQVESAGSPTIFVDVGFSANYNDIGSYAHTGFFRDATDGIWKLYDGYTIDPDSAVDIDVNHPSFQFADLRVGTLIADNLSVSLAAADDSTVGIAAFNSTNFNDDGNGVISAADITITTGSGTAALTIGEGITFAGNATSGITTTADSDGQISFNVVAATLTQRGTASFGAYADSAGEGTRQFTVTSGDVAINAVDGGYY